MLSYTVAIIFIQPLNALFGQLCILATGSDIVLIWVFQTHMIQFLVDWLEQSHNADVHCKVDTCINIEYSKSESNPFWYAWYFLTHITELAFIEQI